MMITETVLEGTLLADGSLVLDAKPQLPPGRVQIILHTLQKIPDLPEGDPFWQRMRAIWGIPRSPGNSDDGGASTLEEIRRSREEWDEHQLEIERLQEVGQAINRPAEGSQS